MDKKELSNAGIDTTIFKAHSRSAAAASKVQQLGASLNEILKKMTFGSFQKSSFSKLNLQSTIYLTTLRPFCTTDQLPECIVVLSNNGNGQFADR